MKLKCSIVILVILASFLFLVSCQNDSGTAEKQQTKLIESYFQDLKNGNTEEASKKVRFTKAEINAGLPDIFCDAMQGYDYKELTIHEIKKLSDSIYLVNATVNTNFDSETKSEYIDVEFNPFIVFYDNEYKIAFVKEQVPQSLYGDLKALPDNYDDNLDYIIFEDGDETFNLVQHCQNNNE